MFHKRNATCGMWAVGKMIAIFCMYIGRMEILPVMLLFIPNLWKD